MNVAEVLPRLESYIAGIDVDRIAESLAAELGWERSVARNHLVTHIAEVRVALRVVGPAINADLRVLEVGSGIGLFAAFLKSLDIDVTELEPVGAGFQFIGEARASLAFYTRPSAHLDIGVEQLQPAVHGRFDLIFSINVLEHVADWRRALEACLSVLADRGQMIHVHPNYAIPFEPHFNVPLVPLRPAVTARLLPGRIADTETWRSLNWITARKVKQWCRSRALLIDFSDGVLADTIDRLITDPLFRERHSGVVGRGAALAARSGLTRVLRRLPATLNTPVEYSIQRTRTTAV